MNTRKMPHPFISELIFGEFFFVKGLITKILCHENLELYGMCCSTAIYIHISDDWSTGVYSTCLHIICVTLMLKFISVMLMLKFLTINYCRVIYQWSLCCNLFHYYVRRCNQSILMHCQSLAFSPVNASLSLKSSVTAVL